MENPRLDSRLSDSRNTIYYYATETSIATIIKLHHMRNCVFQQSINQILKVYICHINTALTTYLYCFLEAIRFNNYKTFTLQLINLSYASPHQTVKTNDRNTLLTIYFERNATSF